MLLSLPLGVRRAHCTQPRGRSGSLMALGQADRENARHWGQCDLPPSVKTHSCNMNSGFKEISTSGDSLKQPCSPGPPAKEAFVIC